MLLIWIKNHHFQEVHSTFQHGQKHDHHLFLQPHELSQQVQLVWVLGQLVLHVGKDVEEASHCVPQPAVSQGQLVQGARALQCNRNSNHLSVIYNSLLSQLWEIQAGHEIHNQVTQWQSSHNQSALIIKVNKQINQLTDRQTNWLINQLILKHVKMFPLFHQQPHYEVTLQQLCKDSTGHHHWLLKGRGELFLAFFLPCLPSRQHVQCIPERDLFRQSNTLPCWDRSWWSNWPLSHHRKLRVGQPFQTPTPCCCLKRKSQDTSF